MKGLVLFLLITLTIAISESEYKTIFQHFKTVYEKSYTSEEEVIRFQIFKENFDYIKSWNATSMGYALGINQFADLTHDEFLRFYTSPFKNYPKPKPNPNPKPKHIITPKVQAGDIVNWATKGAVTPVKNQGPSCGSGWAFSATGAMESSKFIRTGILTSLSEQNLIDCSTEEGNEGCDGGRMDYAFQYVIDNSGIQTEDTYPYNGTGPNNCLYNPLFSGEVISAWYGPLSGAESELQTAVGVEPITAAIDASNNSFQFYKSGVYYEPNCASDLDDLDHGVLVVGYGTDSTGNEYWVVKNSYGTSWGMNGYIQMSRNKNNNCGIATANWFPAQ